MRFTAQPGNARMTLSAEQTRRDKFEIIGRISAGLAHELGGPIGIALGFTELAKESYGPSKTRCASLRNPEMPV